MTTTNSEQELRNSLTEILFSAAGGISDMATREVDAIMSLIKADRARLLEQIVKPHYAEDLYDDLDADQLRDLRSYLFRTAQLSG